MRESLNFMQSKLYIVLCAGHNFIKLRLFFKVNRVDDQGSKLLDGFTAIVVQPFHRDIEQHPRVKIGRKRLLRSVLLFKRFYEISVEVVEVYIFEVCPADESEWFDLLPEHLKKARHYLYVVLSAPRVEMLAEHELLFCGAQSSKLSRPLYF